MQHKKYTDTAKNGFTWYFMIEKTHEVKPEFPLQQNKQKDKKNPTLFHTDKP